MNATAGLVAVVCLYGNRENGAGWLAQTADDLRLGTGEPVAHRSFHEAIVMAMGALEANGVTSGTVQVCDAGGVRVAFLEAGQAVPFSGLNWKAA